jgi:hypothetical protein
MPLAGSGFMIMWHDIASEAEADYHLWHTREHMPERLGLPGFLRGRRGVDWKLDYQRYFTLYEGESLEAFVSPEYLRSLNEPTAWTSRMAPHFRNFLRVACATLASAGRGVGGAVATFRGKLPPTLTEDKFVVGIERLIADIMELPAVTGAHCAGARPRYSSMRTRETELRPLMNERPFDIVIVVEGVGLTELARTAPDITRLVWKAGLLDIIAQTYDMAFLLGRGAE